MMLKSTIAEFIDDLRLPGEAKAEMRRDRKGPGQADPGPAKIIEACAQWLTVAQDRSASADGGVARDYSLINGWATSYPETTGYIVPTMLVVAERLGREDHAQRARRMLDWLVAIQMDGGGFQGGKIDAEPRVPVTFNTGQILLGLAAGTARFGHAYRPPMELAAAWLRDSQDADGAWRKHATPFAEPGEKAYETHVSWGLFEAERQAPGHGFGDAGLRQVDWALGKQEPNGWVRDCCLSEPSSPLTHTLGYYLKGVVEAHRLSADRKYLEGAERTARGLLSSLRLDGALPGRLNADWSAAVPWTCLTGNAQVADSWLYLADALGDERFAKAARGLNAFVRRTIRLDGDEGTRGGVKGSFPVDGSYGRFEYLNWAAKFTIDANISELAWPAAG